MALDIKHWVLSHLIWVVGVGIALVAYHSWIAEHDARLKAEQQIKVSEQVIKGYQAQIDQNTQQIATLQKSMEQVNAAAQKQVQVIVKQVEAVKTPEQAVPAITQLSPVDLSPTTISGSSDRVSVLAVPLTKELGDYSIARTDLAACTKNLETETTIAATNLDNFNKQVAITDEKQKEIVALKKKPSFWHRFGSTMKQVGIGIGIGVALGHRI